MPTLNTEDAHDRHAPALAPPSDLPWRAGRDDPELMMLRFEIDSAEVWTADPGVLGKFKLLTGSPVSAGDVGDHAVGLV